MMDKQTSDERLLKLIEGSADPKRAKNILPLGKKLSMGINPGKFNLTSLKPFKGFSVKLIDLNRGLMGFSVLLTLVLVFVFFAAPATPKSMAAYFSPQDATAVGKVISAIQEQGLIRKSILGQDIKRNIFFPSGVVRTSVNQSEGQVDVTEQVKDLKLVGIVWGANPEIMIENAKDGRTYLLKNGDAFNGDTIKVKEIKRGSAILLIVTENGNQEYEIR